MPGRRAVGSKSPAKTPGLWSIMEAEIASHILSTNLYKHRPPSELLAELHVYLVPKERWVERRKLAKNQVMDYSISSGFLRVHPLQTLSDLRQEIHGQLGYEVVPSNYVFLRSVGRNFTQVKPRQESEMKVKNFMPPYAPEPEIYIKEGIYTSSWSTGEDSGLEEGATSTDNVKRRPRASTPESQDELSSWPSGPWQPTVSSSSTASSDDMAVSLAAATSTPATQKPSFAQTQAARFRGPTNSLINKISNKASTRSGATDMKSGPQLPRDVRVRRRPVGAGPRLDTRSNKTLADEIGSRRPGIGRGRGTEPRTKPFAKRPTPGLRNHNTSQKTTGQTSPSDGAEALKESDEESPEQDKVAEDSGVVSEADAMDEQSEITPEFNLIESSSEKDTSSSENVDIKETEELDVVDEDTAPADDEAAEQTEETEDKESGDQTEEEAIQKTEAEEEEEEENAETTAEENLVGQGEDIEPTNDSESADLDNLEAAESPAIDERDEAEMNSGPEAEQEEDNEESDSVKPSSAAAAEQADQEAEADDEVGSQGSDNLEIEVSLIELDDFGTQTENGGLDIDEKGEDEAETHDTAEETEDQEVVTSQDDAEDVTETAEANEETSENGSEITVLEGEVNVMAEDVEQEDEKGDEECEGAAEEVGLANESATAEDVEQEDEEKGDDECEGPAEELGLATDSEPAENETEEENPQDGAEPTKSVEPPEEDDDDDEKEMAEQGNENDLEIFVTPADENDLTEETTVYASGENSLGVDMDMFTSHICERSPSPEEDVSATPTDDIPPTPTDDLEGQTSPGGETEPVMTPDVEGDDNAKPEPDEDSVAVPGARRARGRVRTKNRLNVPSESGPRLRRSMSEHAGLGRRSRSEVRSEVTRRRLEGNVLRSTLGANGRKFYSAYNLAVQQLDDMDRRRMRNTAGLKLLELDGKVKQLLEEMCVLRENLLSFNDTFQVLRNTVEDLLKNCVQAGKDNSKLKVTFSTLKPCLRKPAANSDSEGILSVIENSAMRLRSDQHSLVLAGKIVEALRSYLAELRQQRRPLEAWRDELLRNIQTMNGAANKNREQEREKWRKRFLETKRQSGRLEEDCARIRQDLEKLIRDLLARVQDGQMEDAPSNDASVSMLGKNELPSNKVSSKIMILRLLQEIEDLRRRVEGTRIRFSAESKLRIQAENDVKALREELLKKKIQVTLTRNQTWNNGGPGTGQVARDFVGNRFNNSYIYKEA